MGPIPTFFLKHKIYSIFIILFILYLLITWGIRRESYYVPYIPKQDLTSLFTKTTFDAADYTLIYAQTGLAAPLVEELKKQPDFPERLLNFQKNFLKKVTLATRPLNLVTREDYLPTQEGLAIPHFDLAPYQKGDIFLTKSTYTLGWRHGHCGIVVDEKRGKTLEAFCPGTISSENDASRWRYYPTFKLLRVKGINPSEQQLVANYALSHLNGLPYSIFANKKLSQQFTHTQCSLLIWQAFYYSLGLDLDTNKGYFVTPQNIASSPYLETLQIMGFNPQKDW